MNMAHEFRYEHNRVLTRVRAVADGVIRITRTRREDFLPSDSAAVIYRGQMAGSLAESETNIRFEAGCVTVSANKKTGALTFLNASGEVLLREPDKKPFLLQDKPVYLHRYDDSAQVKTSSSVDGARASADATETFLDRTAYECKQQFVFDQDEALYGLGSHEEGFGNLRGRARLLYQHNLKAVVPVLVSTKGWGALFDMGCMMAFHDDEEGSYLWADCADELDWYFFCGDGSYASAMERYRLLTGETPMLPRYALGYIQSKERYVDAAEMLDVAAEYRRRQVPLDMIVLDWQSWPQGQWGWKKFDETRFPNTKEFIDKLHEMDVKMMLSIWPSMQGEHNGDRADMLKNGFMLGNKLNYDAFNPAARRLYWQQARDNLFSKGVDAWWCDCTEPFESDWHGPIKPDPVIRAQMNTDEAKRYIDPTKISLYSLHHSQGIWEGQRGETADKRVCNLTRSSWAGQHRYATVTWSGDVSANWETLRRHVPEGLNFCAAGESYWSTDIGGFFPQNRPDAWFYDGDYNEGVNDPGYRELYVRWAQYAAFLPMMRSHGTGTPREIWRFGEKGEPYYDAIEKAIRLRYRLVPYLYTLMAQAGRKGLPMLRVPALVFPADQALRRVSDEMMLGDAILVKPVTHPMGEDDNVEDVYLPAGCRWYNLETGEAYEGGQTICVKAALDSIPALVRGGAIMPWGAAAQSTAQQAGMPVDVTVYPGADGCFTLYDDAGDGYGYERGQYAEIPMRWDDAQGLLCIGGRCGSYPGMPEERILRVKRAGEAAKDIQYHGKEIQIRL